MTEQEYQEQQEQMAAAAQLIINGAQEAKDFKAGGEKALQGAEKALQAANTYKTLNDKTVEKVTDALKDRPAAYVPDTELRKIGNIRLAAPDLTEQAEPFASKVATYLGPSVQKAVDNYLENKKFKLTHEHVTMGQMWQYAEDAAKKRIIILSIAVGVLIAGLTGAGIAYFNSWVHWGYRLEKVCNDSRQTNKNLKDRQDIFDFARRQFKKGKQEREDFKKAVRDIEEELNQLPPVPQK